MRTFSIALLIVSALMPVAHTDAQPYPSRPLRMVVGAATGGTPDILARIIGQELNEQLGQPVIVDKRPGATGNIGADVVAKAAACGHTMIMAPSVLWISPTEFAAFYRSEMAKVAKVVRSAGIEPQ